MTSRNGSRPAEPMRDPLQGGTPADERAFIHKKIIGGFGKIASFVSNVPGVSFLPGASLVRTAGQIATGFSTGGGRSAEGMRFALPEGITPRGPGGLLSAFPGVQGGVTGFAQDGRTPGDCPGVCKPCRTNKSGYYVQSQPGNPSAGGTWVPRGAVCTRSRRMNAGNAGAARRATRRLRSFDKLSRDVQRELKKIVTGRR